MSLLERIKILREANGNISVNKLEKEAGLSRGSMSKWDDHTPSYDKLKKVADYFGVSVSELTGEEQKNAPDTDTAEPGDKISIEESTRLLVALGFIQEGRQLTDDDLAFMGYIVGLIDTWFSGKGH